MIETEILRIIDFSMLIPIIAFSFLLTWEVLPPAAGEQRIDIVLKADIQSVCSSSGCLSCRATSID